jgi:co-chaperonin GroES (HSP10)
MKMISDRVLIEIKQPQNQTKFGIYVAQQPTNEGTVLMVGPRTKYLKPGDKIRHYPHVGVPVEFENKQCLILKEEGEVEIIL